MRVRAGIAVAVVGISSVVGCASNSPAQPTTTEPPPRYVGQVDMPVHAKASNGATADITLNGVSWIPERCAGALPCAVVELTFKGTSAQPFMYYEPYVTAGYGHGPQPWSHPNDSNRVGGDPMVNYAAINKLPPLRMGSVGIPLGGKATWYVEVADPDNVTNIEAGWHAHG